MKDVNRYELSNAAFKIDGYVFKDAQIEATAGKERAKTIAFDLAKKELKSHILRELEIIEDMELKTYAGYKKRDFKV